MRATVSAEAEALAVAHLGGTYERLFNGIEVDRFAEVEPWPVDAELVEDDPEPPASSAPAAVTVDDLARAAMASGRIDAKTGLGTQRKQLVALAAELVGVTVEHADELVADQAVAEELLAKLSTAAPA